MIENPMVIDRIWAPQEQAAERAAAAEIRELKLSQLNDIENELTEIRSRLSDIGREFKNDTALQAANTHIEKAEDFIGLYVKHIEQNLIVLDY